MLDHIDKMGFLVQPVHKLCSTKILDQTTYYDFVIISNAAIEIAMCKTKSLGRKIIYF